MKGLRSFLVIGERNIFAELNQILAIAYEANSIMKIMLQTGYSEQALAENFVSIRALEKKSDDIAFKLGEDITSGAVSPNIIDNLIECVHVADDIVDLYYYLCREVNRIFKADQTGFALNQDAEWSNLYDKLLTHAGESLSKVQLMLSSSSVPEILQLRKEIEAIEEQADDIKDLGFDNLYSVAKQMHFLQFYHYSEMLHKCDDILDSCEDLSDLIVSVVTSILK
ncbi:MAG: DUF47 family protein [Candidatus Bathyarchaeota archaeon]|nr:DUF47 family protein [Candidatus Bathyarchaeota archaeon]